MFFVHIPCLSRFFGVLVLAACRQPGQPEAEAVAALHAKLRPCVRHVPGPVLCPLIRTVLPRRLLSRQVRRPLWTLCLSSQCRSVALPRSVTSCRTLTLRRAFGLLWLTRPWPAARGNAIWNDEWSPPSACWGRSTTWSWTCAQTPLLLLPRPPWAVLCSLFLWIRRHAVPPVTAPAGHALPPFPDAPWPSVDTFFPGTATPPPLSEDTQTLLSSCTSTALPLDAQIPDVLRAKIMAGDYIDLSLLLKPSLIQPQEFALSIDRGASQPTVCVSPARPKDAVLSIDQWGRAFQLYMSVYLLQPANLPCAVKLLKYMEVVRGVGRCGGRLAVLRCRLSDLEGSLRVGLGLHQLGALAEGISVAGWSSAGCWAPLSRPGQGQTSGLQSVLRVQQGRAVPQRHLSVHSQVPVLRWSPPCCPML